MFKPLYHLSFLTSVPPGVGVVTHPADTGFIEDTDNTLSCIIKTEPGIIPSISWYWNTYTHVGSERVSFLLCLYFYSNHARTSFLSGYDLKAELAVQDSCT